MRRVRGLLAILAPVLVLAIAGCGSKSSSSAGGSSASSGASGSSSAAAGSGSSGSSSGSISHTKVKFVLHAGLAFGAFHHFIYKPAKAGEFAHPLSHKLAIIKAAAAGLFVIHEVKLAYADAKADPLLSKLTAPLAALDTKISSLKSDVTSGNVSALTQDNSAITSLESQASGAGAQIKEQVPSSL